MSSRGICFAVLRDGETVMVMPRSFRVVSLWRGGTLMLRFGPAFHAEAEHELAPLARDIFLARYERAWSQHTFAVRFVRHGDGVTGLLVSSDRLKDTWFARF